MTRPRPLGRRAFVSIPHLPGSRMGSSDRTASNDVIALCIGEAHGDHRVIVTEKLDGSCVAIAKHRGQILALGREGALAKDSPNEGRRLFAEWVAHHEQRFARALNEGERFAGEWLALAHATRYALRHDPFVAFDLIRGATTLGFDELRARANTIALPTPHVLHDGGPIAVGPIKEALGTYGHHGALDPAEGAVWRVERETRAKRRATHLAKWVRPDKVDGALLPENTGRPAIWNWRPSPAASLPDRGGVG